MMNNQTKSKNKLTPWLDVLAISIWGVLMLKYWLTGELRILIHPDYFWLVISCAFAFIFIGIWKTAYILLTRNNPPNNDTEQHITLFKPGLSSILLIIVAIIGLTTSPKVFSSQTAIERGITDAISLTRSKPQAFRANLKSEERTIIDWVRTLNTYPEPDAYTGQKVKVQGFVVHSPDLPKDYLLISRFVITCCAADAYPVGLPVKLPTNQTDYPPDIWLEIQGKMTTENLAGKRQLTIIASSLKKIPPLPNPYEY
ncbi:MAG TPA: TIGR03943 family protein [Allocoleopsis sp.]